MSVRVLCQGRVRVLIVFILLSLDVSALNGRCITLKCLNIGALKIINFPFVPNGKLMIFRCPNISAHYN